MSTGTAVLNARRLGDGALQLPIVGGDDLALGAGLVAQRGSPTRSPTGKILNHDDAAVDAIV